MFKDAWKMSLKGKPLQLVSTTDIGLLNANTFTEPDVWKNKQLAINGDELLYMQMAQMIKAEKRKKVPETYKFLYSLVMYFVKEFGNVFSWF